MSIESEITRIENAKLSIKEAIQEKGVEVEDTTIDNYPDKIRQIQTDVFSQSDWNQSDSSSREFIKNKPNISATFTGDITIEAPYYIDLKAPVTFVKELNINDTGILRAESENLVYKDRFGDTHYLIHDDSLKTINGYSLIGNGDIIINNDSKKFIFTPQFTFDEDSFEEYKNADEFYCYDAEYDIYIELYKSPSDGDWVYLSGGTINSETLITVRVSFDEKDVSTCMVNIEKLRVTNIVSDMLTDAGFQQPIEYAITKPIYDGMVLESLYVEPWSTRSLKLDCTSFAEEMYYLYRGSESYEETYLIRFYGYYDNRNIICVTVDLITFTGLLNLIPIGGVSGIQDEGTYIDFTKPINIKDGFFFDTEHAANGKLICDDVGIHYEILAGNPLSEPATIDIIHTGDGTKFLSDDGKYKTALTEHQDISGKQDVLVSGTNIKTINGNSLLGSGDIIISGGDGNSLANVQAVEISDQVEDIVEISGVQYKKTIYVENDSEPNIDLLNENTIYIINQPVIGITIASFNITRPIAEYIIQFSTQDSAYLTLPSNVIWANGQSPKIEANSFYELSINTVLINNNYIHKAILVPFK